MGTPMRDHMHPLIPSVVLQTQMFQRRNTERTQGSQGAQASAEKAA